jgi:hypothetical protein
MAKTTMLLSTAAAIAVATCAAPAYCGLITDWNAKAEAIAIEKRMLPPPNARAMAMLHVAMFDAANAVDRRYAPYRLKAAAPGNASKEAAAAAAGHAVLSVIHPDRKASLDAMLATSLASVADGQARTNGVALGQSAAAGILAWRAEDGTGAPEAYRPHASAGVYVPTVVPVSSTYGGATPWAMTKGSQFRPAPPPALDSDTWANDLKEIRDLGGRNSTMRSPEQTDIGRFWFVTGPQAWNPIVRQLAQAKNLDLVDSARLFALVAMAGDDALIAVFEAKYHYNFWRPVTAVRNADLVGKTAALRQPSWLPLGDTPMHPEYPCAHCISACAVAAVLKSVFGNEIPEVAMTSPAAPGVTRKWKRIQDYADEVSASRIYAGFHYRFSARAGEEMGRQIGELTASAQLRRN